MSTARALLQAWKDLCTRARLKRFDAAGEELVRLYSEPHRRYHTIGHLAQMLKVLREMRADDRLVLAAWFHDAIYQPGASDNEARSAKLARERLLECGSKQADAVFVADAVLATATHVSNRAEFAPLLDADLSILGAPATEYANSCAAIRAEYAAVSDEAFRAGRKAFLLSVLKRPAIFSTPFGVERFEARARMNLSAELRDLSDE